MKQIALCFAFLLLFFSCSTNDWEDTVIKNESGFDVEFKFSNTGTIDLKKGDQATFPTEAYQHLESYSPEKRVYFAYKATDAGYTGKFLARQSWTVKVKNAIGEEASLGADGWMDEIKGIPDGDQSNSADYQGKVYTDTPTFIVTKTASNFPAIAVYNRGEDGTFNVSIQWGK